MPDDSRAAQRVSADAPEVEVADDADGRGVRRPDGEVDALLAVDGGEVGAEHVVEPDGAAFVEQVDVVVGQQRWFCRGHDFTCFRGRFVRSTCSASSTAGTPASSSSRPYVVR